LDIDRIRQYIVPILGDAVPQSDSEDLEDVARNAGLPRHNRKTPWLLPNGKCYFILADHYAKGVFEACTVTCLIHDKVGRCNKNLSCGDRSADPMTRSEARRRVKRWCLMGANVLNDDHGKAAHMHINPRFIAEADIGTIEEIENDYISLELLLEASSESVA
jgi:hypothetical protein